ncbi:hypothetical protein IOD13_11470 [Brevibacterium casei]|nr:hypothetical protein [Brevibacterium casei]
MRDTTADLSGPDDPTTGAPTPVASSRYTLHLGSNLTDLATASTTADLAHLTVFELTAGHILAEIIHDHDHPTPTDGTPTGSPPSPKPSTATTDNRTPATSQTMPLPDLNQPTPHRTLPLPHPQIPVTSPSPLTNQDHPGFQHRQTRRSNTPQSRTCPTSPDLPPTRPSQRGSMTTSPPNTSGRSPRSSAPPPPEPTATSPKL